MKYLILIYTNPKSRELWESFTDAERAGGFKAHVELAEELAASGELIVSEALADASQGKLVKLRDGRPITSDGPFAEAKEQLAGFYLIECDGIERAIECAAQVPEVEFSDVEVRPILSLGGLEM
jgi:hypothetical protein